MNTLGLDLSLTSTGLSVIDENGDVIYYARIVTRKKDFDNILKRIHYISKTIHDIAKEFDCQYIGIEDTYASSKNYAVSKQLQLLCGSVIYPLINDGFNVDIITATHIRKNLTGVNKSKEGLYKWIVSNVKGLEDIEGIDKFNDRNNKNKNSDIVDATAIALYVPKKK